MLLNLSQSTNIKISYNGQVELPPNLEKSWMNWQMSFTMWEIQWSILTILFVFILFIYLFFLLQKNKLQYLSLVIVDDKV